MQSTFTPSRSISASRSSGSKRASWSSAAAPRSQGAMKALRADFDQPLAAVHQHRSPSRAPNQCSACTSLADQVALPVADRLGLARGAGGEDHERGIVGRRDRPRAPGPPRSGARRAPPARARRSPQSRTRPASRSSATTARGLHGVHARRRSSGRSCSVQGRATAPIRKQATIASTHSGRFPITVITAVAAADPARRQGAREPGRAFAHLAKADLAAVAGARQRHQRRAFGRGRVDDIAGEVHGGKSALRTTCVKKHVQDARSRGVRRRSPGDLLPCRTPNPRHAWSGGTKVALSHWGEPPNREARKLFQREPDS